MIEDDGVVEGSYTIRCDVVVDGAHVFVGHGQRSDPAGLAFLQQRFGRDFEIVPLPCRSIADGEDVLHLDCAFNPLGKGHALIYPGGLETIPQILQHKYAWIEVSREEAAALATNVLSIAPDTVIARAGPECARVNGELRKAIENPRRSALSVEYPEPVEAAIARLIPLLPRATLSPRALALMILEGDRSLEDWLRSRLPERDMEAIREVRAGLRAAIEHPVPYLVNRACLEQAGDIAALAVRQATRPAARRGLAARLAGRATVLSRRVDNPESRLAVALKYRLYHRVVTISEAIAKLLESEGVARSRLR